MASAGIATDQRVWDRDAFGHWNVKAKREYLDMLSNKVWDIEAELARAKAERARLMSSLQSNREQ